METRKQKRKILPQSYFNRPTLAVARSLVGKYLIRENGKGTIAGKIIEVEAYVGTEDKACHASKGRTARTEVLFGPPGIAYVYLIYGMYDMLNVVTERLEVPAAVLVRAIEVDGRLAKITDWRFHSNHVCSPRWQMGRHCSTPPEMGIVFPGLAI